MGLLRAKESGQGVKLRAEHILGRSRRCDHTVENGWAQVSSRHASLRWNGASWTLRDLGSTNGTWLNGATLPAGEHPLAQGDEFQLGAEGPCFVLEATGAPTATALGVDGEVVDSVGNLLALPPEPAEPLVMIFLRSGGWVADWVSGPEQQVSDGENLTVAGEQWELHLPLYEAPTLVVGETYPVVDNLGLEFTLNEADEVVEVFGRLGEDRFAMPPRAHHYMMVVLARRRLEEAEAGHPDPGWMYLAELRDELRYTDGRINLLIHRGRQQLAQQGIENAHQLVERRRNTQQLRLGVSRLAMRKNGPPQS